VLDADTVKAALRLPSTWFSVERLGAHAGKEVTKPALPPPGRFIVMLASTPIADGKPPAPAGARVGRSDDLGSGLKPGYWVVYAGRYATRSQAEAAARRHPGALVRVLF
jgi:hypothetical protein